MDVGFDKDLHTLLGFLAGLAVAWFAERGKETRRRIALIRVIEWQLQALVDACRWALQSQIWDSVRVENFARYIQQTFLRRPELVVAARRLRTRNALANAYDEASALLDLINLHRDQLRKIGKSAALDSGNYNGIIKRRRLFDFFSVRAGGYSLPGNEAFGT